MIQMSYARIYEQSLKKMGIVKELMSSVENYKKSRKTTQTYVKNVWLYETKLLRILPF